MHIFNILTNKVILAVHAAKSIMGQVFSHWGQNWNELRGVSLLFDIFVTELHFFVLSKWL